jgi:hypothetical protein
MMWKLSEIEIWQVFRQYVTCQEFGIVFRQQLDVELRPAVRQEVDIWNMYCVGMVLMCVTPPTIILLVVFWYTTLFMAKVLH